MWIEIFAIERAKNLDKLQSEGKTIGRLHGIPCIKLPLLLGENELPLGIQLVGNYTADEKSIYTANWLLNFIKKENHCNRHLSDK